MRRGESQGEGKREKKEKREKKKKEEEKGKRGEGREADGWDPHADIIENHCKNQQGGDLHGFKS